MEKPIIIKSLGDCPNCGKEPKITWSQDIGGYPGWRIMCDCGKMMFINVPYYKTNRHDKYDKLMELLRAWNENELPVLR